MPFSKEEGPSSTDPLSDERALSDGPVAPEDIISLGGSAPPCVDIVAASPLISSAIYLAKGACSHTNSRRVDCFGKTICSTLRKIPPGILGRIEWLA